MDDNNGTLWRAKENHQPAWLMIDLEKITDVQTVAIQFEYPTYAYQYRIETSTDANTWTTYEDQSNNNRWASPILVHGKVKARYVRLHLLHTQLPGLPRGIWNIKVYCKPLEQQTVWSAPQIMPPKESIFGTLIHMDAEDYQEGERIKTIQNKGLLQGTFDSEKPVYVKNYQGKKAFFLNGSASLRSTFKVPQSLAGNSPYTVSMWINNPQIDRFESVVAWSTGNQDISKAVFGYGKDEQRGAVTHGAWPDLGFKSLPPADQWHHIIISFDGYRERIYVDGKLQREENRMLFVHPADYFVLGASDLLDQHFSGYLADVKIANIDLSAEIINTEKFFFNSKDVFFAVQTDDLDLGKVSKVRNHGAIMAHDVAVDRGEVLIQGNRTALKVGAWKDSLLTSIIAQPSYTLAFDWFDGQRWNHGLVLYDQGKTVFYKNSKQDLVQNINKLLRIKDGEVAFQHAFHFFSAYPRKFTVDQIEENDQIWKAKSAADLNKYAPNIAVKPYWINDDHVFVQIRPDRTDLLYLFSTDQYDSGWIQESYHLFDRVHLGKTISVFAKDEFGNVSQAQRLVVPKQKPSLLVQASNQTFTLGDKEIPYWDGYQIGGYPDSTEVEIKGTHGQWTLSSKHTKWDDVSLLPPFIYKELEGDFTVQVQVKDGAGLISKTRTSSEAGMMIQATENPNAYINNTILTGWNLGNLARSIGNQIHQEGNNGTGLQYSPYIQVQKVGNYFFLRSSQDGVSWIDLPNTPFLREDLKGKKLRVGLYQIATNNQEGYGVFEGFKIWQ
ncbi:discoidin domain-containing protein [Sphingobacterium sp. KU25419]|nr:discoidin domain-containing protein [Sphingobacterium sp. KU25419]